MFEISKETITAFTVLPNRAIMVSYELELSLGGRAACTLPIQTHYRPGDDVSALPQEAQDLIGLHWTPAFLAGVAEEKRRALAETEAARVAAFNDALAQLQAKRDEMHAAGATNAVSFLDTHMRNLTAMRDGGAPLPEMLALPALPASPAPAPAPAAGLDAAAEVLPVPEPLDDTAADGADDAPGDAEAQRAAAFAEALGELGELRSQAHDAGDGEATARYDAAIGRLTQLRDSGADFPAPEPDAPQD